VPFIKLFSQAMEKSEKNKFLIDGFPRNKDNLDGWEREMGDKVNLEFVLFFDCPQEVIRRPLSLVFLCRSQFSNFNLDMYEPLS
jgi:adenylate kinase family enzyme